MGDASGEGLRLIAAHLAKVKLEFAEREYAAKSRIGNLEHELDDTLLRLEEATKDVANYQAQVKQLQGQNTYKALVQEREKWKSLTDTLRKDNRALRAQIDQLQHGQLQKPSDQQQTVESSATASSETESRTRVDAEDAQPKQPKQIEESKTSTGQSWPIESSLDPSSSPSSSTNDLSLHARKSSPVAPLGTAPSGTAPSGTAPSGTAPSGSPAGDGSVNQTTQASATKPLSSPSASWNSSGSGAEPDLLYHPARRRQDSLTDRSAELVQLRSEINFLKHELEDKNVEINALRAKLDRELELKWERSHGGSSGADPVAPNGGGGWKRSLFESVAEVLAPFPHASAEENDADADQESPELYDYNGSTYDNDPRAGHDKRIPTSINHQGGSAHAHHTDAVVESASF